MEQFENLTTQKPEREKTETIERKYELGRLLCESGVVFSWPGIDPSAYTRIKSDEEEFPGYATPVDAIIARCKTEGIKVVVASDSSKRDVYIMPALSTDVANDSLRPKHLQIEAYMDGDLAELISLSKIDVRS
jgi:hypothetical protein